MVSTKHCVSVSAIALLVITAPATAAQDAKAPAALKSMPLGGDASLTLTAEARFRYDMHDNARATPGNDYRQGLFRGVVGADLRLNRHFRIFGEVASGQVAGRRSIATANFQNAATLQQLYFDLQGEFGMTTVGAQVGRQEFADGPRQLISLSDGPNIHRTWNGVRLYANGDRFRFGVFDLRATRLGRDLFDERVNFGEQLKGVNASLSLASAAGHKRSLDPFWFHSENPSFRSGRSVGLDIRDTFGLRLWGQQGNLKYDWTLAHQTGSFMDRDINAWGLFTIQSLTLSNAGWKPRLTAHIDIASGGRASESGTLRGFNQLYASSSYLGEGQFLSLSNLLMIAPGMSLSPSAKTNLSMEYGFAWRLDQNDAAYAGGMRAYPGTEDVPRHEIGGLLRVMGSWSDREYLTVFFNYEHFDAGDVLKGARLPSGSYGTIGVTYRY